jgi:hypothetical protein
MELLGTHFSLRLGAWRLRFCIAIEDTDLQPQSDELAFEAPPRLAPADKLNRIYPNRR